MNSQQNIQTTANEEIRYDFFIKNTRNTKFNKFTNKIRIEGYNDTYLVYDEDEHITEIYEKELKVKKLPSSENYILACHK